MLKIKNELRSNRKIYREIFIKSQNEFISLVNTFKEPIQCSDCKQCCKLIYAEKTPEEILNLINSGNDTDKYWKNFIELYIPLGYDSNFDWLSSEVDLNLNRVTAANIDKDYTVRVLSFNNNATFYYCKHFSNNKCSIEGNEPDICNNYPPKLLTVLHNKCSFNAWQNKVESFLKKDLSQQVYAQINKISEYRKKFTCNRSGICCRLSSSEHSYEDLQKRSRLGDKFASQFISVFKPYDSFEEAREVFPEYVDYVLSEFGDDEKIYFYHCPHIDKDNLCTIYDTDKRPDICRDFPSNPLAIMFPECGYIEWKSETIITALTSHAMIEICMYTLDKLDHIKSQNKG